MAMATNSWSVATGALEHRGTSGTGDVGYLGYLFMSTLCWILPFFPSLQASDASRLPLLKQQNAGVGKQGACPGYPRDAPAYNVPSALEGGLLCTSISTAG